MCRRDGKETLSENPQLTLSQRMRANLGSIKPTIKVESPTNPFQRRIAAKLAHIDAIKADRFYNRKDDAAWIAGIRKEIRTLKEEFAKTKSAPIALSMSA